VPSGVAEGVRTIHVGSYPEGVSSDGTHVWVTNQLEETVSEIPIGSIPLPRASIASPASGGIYAQDALVTTRFSCTDGDRESKDGQTGTASISYTVVAEDVHRQ
jgi:DNA-binding beta-propeller fold protein YncE